MLQFFMLIIVAKNIFLILGERPTDDIDDNVDTAEKNWVLILPKEIKCFFSEFTLQKWWKLFVCE